MTDIKKEILAVRKELRESAENLGKKMNEVNETLASDVENKEVKALSLVTKDIEPAIKALNALEQKYAILKAGTIFECVKVYSYAFTKLKQNLDDEGVWLSIEPETATKPFNLETATTVLGTSKEWITKASIATFYFAYESAIRHGISEAEILKLNTSFRMKKIARQSVETGINPCSKTQMRNTLQGVIDSLLGETVEKYNVNNYDVEYMRTCFTGKGKGQCKLSLATGKKFNALLIEVATRLINRLEYSFDDRVFAKEPHETPIVADIKTAFTTEEPTAEPEKTRRGRKSKAEKSVA